MTEVKVKVNSNGEIVLPPRIVQENAGTTMVAHRNKQRIQVRLEVGPAAQQDLTIAQWLETLSANVTNGVLAAEIDKGFRTLPAGRFLKMGISRSCQPAAILAVSRIYDTNREATTLPMFLDFAELHATEFPDATPGQVKQAVCRHREWIETNETIPAIRQFRNTQWGHTDTEALRDYFAGYPDNVSLPGFDLFDVSDVLEHTRQIVSDFAVYFGSQPLDLEHLREEIAQELAAYARFRS